MRPSTSPRSAVQSSHPVPPPSEQEQYAAQFTQLDKEALATVLAAVLITVLFWAAIYFTADMQSNILAMPLWFVISCLGGYLFSIVVVVVLVTKFMSNCRLDVPSLQQLEHTQSNAPLEPESAAADDNKQQQQQQHKDA
ncbi:MAG: YhdT family protein [Candidatus Anaerobiospirillum pullicola]|uniref:YhdT family protein n=1 Tax=Candidatus Anaerobiospirillum pullicola TaxID=2838451 RepID=A0A948TH91_9GAMM|nr:YhdT family protein [Candidatus Anaerobiospirillum pullicola]